MMYMCVPFFPSPAPSPCYESMYVPCCPCPFFHSLAGRSEAPPDSVHLEQWACSSKECSFLLSSPDCCRSSMVTSGLPFLELVLLHVCLSSELFICLTLILFSCFCRLPSASLACPSAQILLFYLFVTLKNQVLYGQFVCVCILGPVSSATWRNTSAPP